MLRYTPNGGVLLSRMTLETHTIGMASLPPVDERLSEARGDCGVDNENLLLASVEHVRAHLRESL